MSDAVLPLTSLRARLVKQRYRPADALSPDQADRLDAVLGERTMPETRHAARRLASGGHAMERPEEMASIVAHIALIVARAGGRLHVISLGDAAERMGESLGPPLARFGIRAAVIGPKTAIAGRAMAYTAPVVFLGAQDAGLDVLRARNAGARVRGMRGAFAQLAARPAAARLAYPEDVELALVLDGEDTLISRSLTGIVLTGKADASTDDGYISATEALSVATLLEPEHFRAHGAEIRLSQTGRDRLFALVQTLGPGWINPARSELSVSRALAALHLWREGEDFMLDEDSALTLSETLRACAHDNPGLDPGALIAARHRFGSAGKERGAVIERIALREVLKRYRRLSAFVVDAARHEEELRSAYDLVTFGKSPVLSSEICLHPEMMQPFDGATFCLSGGTSRDADRLRAFPGLGDLIWPVLPERPIGSCVVLSQNGHLWPNWARDSDTKRVRLLPARETEPPLGSILSVILGWPGGGILHKLLFAHSEKKRLAEDRIQRQALFGYDRSCREAVHILGSNDA